MPRIAVCFETAIIGHVTSPVSNPAPADDPKTLHCTEVWGGNMRVERTVVLPGLDAWVFSDPCDHSTAGGDVHYVSACAGGQVVRVLVADVSGHGADVADAANHLRRLMRRHVNHHSQRRFVRSLNREFSAAATDGKFATAVAITFDSTAGTMLVCNAGHPPPLWYRSADQSWTTLESRGADASGNVPWGVLDAVDYEQFAVPLAVGDLVLCYTDSMSEARYASGELIGTEGLLALVRGSDLSDPASLLPKILAKLGELDPANLTRDDVTGLLLRSNGSRPSLPLADRLLASARALAGFAGVHLPWTGRP
jgi:sigma-B regulation protein RsbU (phosphoserine phosphatase)